MSHFVAVVRMAAKDAEELIRAERIKGNKFIPQEPESEALLRVLAPYKERGAGSDDPEGLSDWLEFEDEEPESLEDWKTGSVEMIRLSDGSLFYTWDDRFKVRGVSFLDEKVVFPEGSEKVAVPFKERFKTFEEFMAEWKGMKDRDPRKGRYGYWRNPDQKWDWYMIGGRWDKFFPNKQNVMEVSEIDFESERVLARARAENLWRKRNEAIQTKGESFKNTTPWGDPDRGRMIDMGLISCVAVKDLTGKEFCVVPWKMHREDRRDPRADVFTDITADDFYAKFTLCFVEFLGRAFIDATKTETVERNGKTLTRAPWTEPGRMGWFGCSSDTPNSLVDYQNMVFASLQEGDRSDVLVAVDFHI